MDNEQQTRFLEALDRDVRDLRRVVGLFDENRGLMKQVDDIEKRIADIEFADRTRTTLIYTSIIIGMANLLAVIGLYLRF